MSNGIEDGLLEQKEWQRFLQGDVQLGFPHAEGRKPAQPYAPEFVEHFTQRREGRPKTL